MRNELKLVLYFQFYPNMFKDFLVKADAKIIKKQVRITNSRVA